MAKRKPQTPKGKLRVVDASYKPRCGAVRDFDNGHAPPCELTKHEQHAWNQAIRILPWLQPTDLPTAVMWCRLWVQWVHTASPSIAMGARLSRLGMVLGMSPLARKRLGVDARRPRLTVLPPASDATKYFDDRKPDGAA